MSSYLESRQAFEAKVIEKAWEDAEFRSELKSDPKAAIEKAFGGKAQINAAIKVVEETANEMYLVIPGNPDATGELSTEDLESVAGGWKVEIGATTCCFTSD
ncbi:NHLP leader peptide family RiPP precursor [candidate division KSB1 bacterium]|nr:NHLP leader peptide family RiPP precursor [candidate division KSB1 bacterium]